MKNKSGFTIVELLIVIVVVGILATITIVAYDGISRRASNTARVSELNQWVKSFTIYRATYGHYPTKPGSADSYCLGTGFPEGGACGDVYDEQVHYESPALMNEIKKISDLPSGPREMVHWSVGPYVTYQTYDVSLVAVLDLPDGTCEDHSLITWWQSSSNGKAFCAVELEY